MPVSLAGNSTSPAAMPWAAVLKHGRPLGSGGTVQLRYGTCTTWTEGKAVLALYWDRDRALADAGMER